MNRDLTAALGQVGRPQSRWSPKSRARALFDELNLRLVLIEKEKNAEHEVQIIATVAGARSYVRRLGILDGDVVTLETYHDAGYSITVAPIEQTAFTIHVLKKVEKEPRKFMGFSTAPHEDNRG